jgi:hypothetical protein
MYCGGWLYPEEASAGFGADAGFEEDGAGRAAARTPTRETTKAVAAEQRKGFRILIVFSLFGWTNSNG